MKNDDIQRLIGAAQLTNYCSRSQIAERIAAVVAGECAEMVQRGHNRQKIAADIRAKFAPTPVVHLNPERAFGVVFDEVGSLANGPDPAIAQGSRCEITDAWEQYVSPMVVYRGSISLDGQLQQMRPYTVQEGPTRSPE